MSGSAESRRSALIEAADRSGPLALSLAQQRLWFLMQRDDAGEHTPITSRFRIRLRGVLDRSALRAALDGIVARHESLRTISNGYGAGGSSEKTRSSGSGFALERPSRSPQQECTPGVACVAGGNGAHST